jgi:hypothetical protein
MAIKDMNPTAKSTEASRIPNAPRRAALSGGTADLDLYVLTATQLGLTEHVLTPWVTNPELYSASCKQGGGATWLQVTSLAGKSQTRPIVSDNVVGSAGGLPAPRGASTGTSTASPWATCSRT